MFTALLNWCKRWLQSKPTANPDLKPEYPELEKLEVVLNYRFNNRQLLAKALSHRSWVNSLKTEVKPESNERLEFLGDSILNAVITDHLYHTYPDREEGLLSKMKSLVVSAKVLGLCADSWKLGDFVFLSRSEEKAGGRSRPSILADAYEAVLGAVYLDGGMVAARRLVHDSLVSILKEVLADDDLANYKSELLEYTQSRGLGVPVYDVLEESGPEHAKRFVVGVFVQNQEWGRGRGTSKKSAEQMGARAALAEHRAESSSD
jgi:ribonuclease III